MSQRCFFDSVEFLRYDRERQAIVTHVQFNQGKRIPCFIDAKWLSEKEGREVFAPPKVLKRLACRHYEDIKVEIRRRILDENFDGESIFLTGPVA